MAKTKLQQYFPIIRTREQILLEIKCNPALNVWFETLSEDSKKEFLDICSGEKGVKILYDSFFKSVMNPEVYPERLQDMLSCILGEEIASFHVLESSSFALGDERSLLILDIIVELIEGSIINLEVQKIGFDFPGERAACYASDLTLRQYARAKRAATEKPETDPGHKFSYRSIHPVYTIVLIEKSSSIFTNFPDTYIHRFSQKSDTGLHMNLLHNYIFIPLDIFRKKLQNKDISTRLDAWLMFLSTDEPDEIMHLCDAFPSFKELYLHIYEICKNMEDVMGIFSEALAEMDRNTVDYMIDTLRKNNEQLQGKNEQLQGKNEQLQGKNEQLQGKNEQLQGENEQLHGENKKLREENARMREELEKYKN